MKGPLSAEIMRQDEGEPRVHEMCVTVLQKYIKTSTQVVPAPQNTRGFPKTPVARAAQGVTTRAFPAVVTACGSGVPDSRAQYVSRNRWLQ